uniref:E3 ubiquitin/ISG15 ligase TRIM25-like isoform X2 n=1 Tax=Myodes glareolus TaxID=447135 RepID=UPI002021C3DE|nr:E3 ubiquitin/ISG15 ligase TRIM25-like isoform X2 [Myodes glareolus]
MKQQAQGQESRRQSSAPRTANSLTPAAMQKVSRPVQDQASPQLSSQSSRVSQIQLLASNNSSQRMLEDQVLCPICLEVFRNPVTTACGHNFCMLCLQSFWDHLAAIGETYYCPQCRETFPTRPRLCKNAILGEMVACFTQAKSQTSGPLRNLAGPTDVPCDFCSPQKLKSVKSCLQCMASLCEKHLRSHFEDQLFQDHQLLEPVWDLKNRLCRKHRKLRQLYCRTEGSCVCGTCLLEDHKNHDTTPLEDERARKEVEVRKVQANVENQMLIIASDSQKHHGRKLIQTMRDEVNNCFSEILHEIKQLQIKVLEFVEKEEAAALGKLGNSIQQSHNRFLSLEGDSLWLQSLLTNRSDEQFLQEFPRLKHYSACVEPLMGTSYEETHCFLQLPETLAQLRTRLTDIGLSFVNQLLLKGHWLQDWSSLPLDGCWDVRGSSAKLLHPSSPGIKMSSYEVLPSAVDRKTLLQCYCNLNFDPATASEELFLFKETHSVLNLGILLEPSTTNSPLPGFKQWPQVLCCPGLSEGCHYWEAEVSNSWMCLGVTYRHCPPLGSRPRRNIVYLLGRNPYSWCLEWDSLKFSVWHNNMQTVLQGSYHHTLGVALDFGAGCLSFYGVTGGMSLLYRFLTSFLEPLYPAVMVSSGASLTLKQYPEA